MKSIKKYVPLLSICLLYTQCTLGMFGWGNSNRKIAAETFNLITLSTSEKEDDKKLAQNLAEKLLKPSAHRQKKSQNGLLLSGLATAALIGGVFFAFKKSESLCMQVGSCMSTILGISFVNTFWNQTDKYGKVKNLVSKKEKTIRDWTDLTEVGQSLIENNIQNIGIQTDAFKSTHFKLQSNYDTQKVEKIVWNMKNPGFVARVLEGTYNKSTWKFIEE
ncbi:MAG TPA: hypothetical protein VGW78_02175 [Candidatus Babeliales bacterium]|nr:hypothetical protein [Candidatus Babeliales bacterium]